MPNDTPQIATQGGGVIGASGTTYDQNGNIDGQMPNVSNYSWKGAYLLAQNVSSTSVPYPPISPAKGAVAGGNITGNGATLGHQSFGLAWCGKNTPGGLSECTGIPEKKTNIPQDMVFLYHNLCNTSVPDGEFASAYPDWVANIENAALLAFKYAFHNYPISVVRASKHGQTTWAACQSDPKCINDPTDVTDQNHIVRVAGNLDPTAVGQTYSTCLNCGGTQSDVFYYPVMEYSESAWWGYNSSAKNWCPNYPPQNASDLQKFAIIVNTTGIAIGNAAAHEIGHQLDGFPFMDCGPPDTPGAYYVCENNDEFVYNFWNENSQYNDPKNPNDPANGGEFFYELPTEPLIHWQKTTDCYLDWWSTHTSWYQILVSANPCQ